MLRSIFEITYLLLLVYICKLYYTLIINVIKLRRQNKIRIGSKGIVLERAIRAHANFCETVPIILLLSFILYFNNLLFFAVPMIIFLAIGRTLHSKAISNKNENLDDRRKGMKLTFLSLITGVTGVIYYIITLIYFSALTYINTTLLPQLINLTSYFS